MSGWDPLGRLLAIAGLIMLAAGGFFLLGGRIAGLGRLPGDIIIQKGNFRFYFPLTTGLLLSLLLTVLLRLFGRR